jgi:hypothetical protein
MVPLVFRLLRPRVASGPCLEAGCWASHQTQSNLETEQLSEATGLVSRLEVMDLIAIDKRLGGLARGSRSPAALEA